MAVLLNYTNILIRQMKMNVTNLKIFLQNKKLPINATHMQINP